MAAENRVRIVIDVDKKNAASAIASVEKAVDGMGASVGRNRTKMAGWNTDALATIRQMKALAAAAGVAAAAYKAMRIAQAAREQEKQFGSALNDMRKVTERELGVIRREILSLPAALGGSTQLMRGYYQVMSAGITEPTRAMADLVKSSKAAQAAHVEQAEVIKAGTKLMKGFAGEIESLGDAYDLLFRIERVGQTSFRELVPVIGDVASVSQQAGVSQYEMAAALAELTQTAGSTAEAATKYRAILTGLLRPNQAMTDVLKDMDFATGKAALEQLGFAETLQRVEKAAKKSNTPIQKLFESIEASTGLGPMMADGFEAFNQKLREVQVEADETEKAFERWKTTSEGIEETFRNTLGKVMIEWGEKLAPKVNQAMMELTDWMNEHEQDIELWGQVIATAAELIINKAGSAAGQINTLFKNIQALYEWSEKHTPKSIQDIFKQIRETPVPKIDDSAFFKPANYYKIALGEIEDQITRLRTSLNADDGFLTGKTRQGVDALMERRIDELKTMADGLRSLISRAEQGIDIQGIRLANEDLSSFTKSATAATAAVSALAAAMPDTYGDFGASFTVSDKDKGLLDSLAPSLAAYKRLVAFQDSLQEQYELIKKVEGKAAADWWQAERIKEYTDGLNKAKDAARELERQIEALADAVKASQNVWDPSTYDMDYGVDPVEQARQQVELTQNKEYWDRLGQAMENARKIQLDILRHPEEYDYKAPWEMTFKSVEELREELKHLKLDTEDWEKAVDGVKSAFKGFFRDFVSDPENALKNFGNNLQATVANSFANIATEEFVIPVIIDPMMNSLESAFEKLGIQFGEAVGYAMLAYLGVNAITDFAQGNYGSSLGAVGGMAIGAYFGGPMGAVVGGALGQSIGGLFDGGNNAGWGFQTPESTGGYGQNPLNPADFYTAEGSDGTSLADLSSYVAQLIDAVDSAIDETVDEIQGLGDMMSGSIGRKFMAALDNITITLPQFGLNEENFSEMMGNVAGYVRDEMLRQAAPAIGDALAAQWGTSEWMSAIPAMSDDSAVRADYEALLVAYQKMRAEVDAYGQATVETVEEMIEAAGAFNETLDESVGWIKDGMADAMKDALAADDLAAGMTAFKTSFRQTIYDSMLSGMIEAAINSAMLEPYMATFSSMLEDAFAQPTVDGMTAGVEAAVAYWDAEVQPRADLVAETLYNAVSGSSLAAFLDDTADAADNAADRIAAMNAHGAQVYQNQKAYIQQFADRLDEVNDAVQKALHGYNDLAAELADIRAQWTEYETILRESGHWAWAEQNDPAFLEQFRAAWDAVKQAAIDDAWGKIVEDYRDAMGTADDLSGTIADINDRWDENIETLTVAAQALGLTTEALQAWIDVANTARETAIANARAEQAKAVIQSQRDLAQYFPGYDANAQTIANIAADYGIAVETITAEWIQNVMKYFMGLPASGAGGVAEIFGSDWEEVADDIAALGQVLKNLTDQAATAYQSMQSALNSALDTQYYQAYLAQNPAGTRGSYLLDVLQTGQADLLSKVASGDMGYTLDNLVEAASLVSQWYTQAVAEAETTARTWMQVTDAAQSMIDSIQDLITDIKYSDLNVMLPNQKALEAATDYKTLRDAALAQGATTADVQAFTDFARTYLETSKAALGSGVTYQDRYQAVLDDLAAVQGGLAAGNYDQAIYNELTAQTETVHADLTEINASLASFMDTLDYLFALKTGGLDVGGTGGIDLGDLGTSIDTEGVPQGDEIPAGMNNVDLETYLGADSEIVSAIDDVADLLTNKNKDGVYQTIADGWAWFGGEWYQNWLQEDLYRLLGEAWQNRSAGIPTQIYVDSGIIQAIKDIEITGGGTSTPIDLSKLDDIAESLTNSKGHSVATLLSNNGVTSEIGMNGVMANFGWWLGNHWYPKWLQEDLYRLFGERGQSRSIGYITQNFEDSALVKLNYNMASVAEALGVVYPQYASGGIVDRPHMGVVGEAGPEAIIPINADHSLKAPVVINGEASRTDTRKIEALLEALLRERKRPTPVELKLDNNKTFTGTIREISDDQSYQRDVRVHHVPTKRLL